MTDPAAATTVSTVRRRKPSVLIRAGIGIATFVILFLFFHPAEIIEHLAEARLSLVVYGFLLCIAGLLARAFRWMRILGRLGIRVPYWRTVEIYTISFWFNTFLPGSMGGDIYKIVDVARASDKKLRPAITVIAERAMGVLALLLVAAVGLFLYHARLPYPPWLMWLLLAAVGAGIAAGMTVLLGFDRIWSPISKRVPVLSRILNPEKTDSIGMLSAELRTKPMLFIEALVLGLVIQMLALVAYWVLALAIIPGISPLFFFTLFPLIEIVSLMPITINGIGVREGLLVFGLRYTGIDPAFSMSLGVLYRLIVIVLAIIGGLLLILRRSGWRTG